MSDKCHCGLPFIKHSGVIQTLVYYPSPVGHNHDDDCKSVYYTCSEGHETKVAIRSRCNNPDCTWVGRETCFCHPGKKLDELPVILK